MLVSVSQLYIT